MRGKQRRADAQRQAKGDADAQKKVGAGMKMDRMTAAVPANTRNSLTGQSTVPGAYDSLATLCGLHVLDAMDQQFELLLFVYSFAQLILQNHNIYRSNFLDVDYYAFTFSAAALLRRFFWKAAQASFLEWADDTGRRGRPSAAFGGGWQKGSGRKDDGGSAKATEPKQAGAGGQLLARPQLVLCSAAVGVLLLVSAYCGVVLATRYPPMHMVYVVGPVLAYFGAAGRLLQDPPEKCLRLEWKCSGESEDGSEGCCDGKSKQDADHTDDGKVTYLVLSRHMLAKQCRAMLYAAFSNAYYVGVIPTIFTPNEHTYWPLSRSRVLTCVVFLNTLVLLCLHLLSRSFMHYVAYVHTYGCWEQVSSDDPSVAGEEPEIWKSGVAYDRGTVVRFHPAMVPKEGGGSAMLAKVGVFLSDAKLFRGVAYTNCAVPGEAVFTWAYRVFATPYKAQAVLALSQLAVSMVLLALAMRSVVWYTYGTMVVFNYVFLVLCVYYKRRARLDRHIASILGRLSEGKA
eukprot:TRINITY_DN11580_c3_g1_i1.p1 TRINITY_DN11580_c3_g1~~TRINITY_DN11580_c3_g1_i1.p1  ORF type:complete len:512 (+),score=160.89 TRINITY_DN11580_c3_g1_i1:235-1770(+)